MQQIQTQSFSCIYKYWSTIPTTGGAVIATTIALIRGVSNASACSKCSQK